MSDTPLKIDGLKDKPEPKFEELGTFKLKDKVGRNVVQIDLTKVKRPLTEALALYIAKIQGANNKIRVMIQWKPEVIAIRKVHDEHISQLLKKGVKNEIQKP